MFQVGEVARRLGVNPQTLYFYERIGLIPSPERTAAGYRLYDESDLERLSFVVQAKALGLTLNEIKELLILQDGEQLFCQEVYDRLRRKIEQIDDNIRQLQTLKAQLNPLLDRCQQGMAKSDPKKQCVVLRDASMTTTNSSQNKGHNNDTQS